MQVASDLIISNSHRMQLIRWWHAAICIGSQHILEYIFQVYIQHDTVEETLDKNFKDFASRFYMHCNNLMNPLKLFGPTNARSPTSRSMRNMHLIVKMSSRRKRNFPAHIEP